MSLPPRPPDPHKGLAPCPRQPLCPLGTVMLETIPAVLRSRDTAGGCSPPRPVPSFRSRPAPGRAGRGRGGDRPLVLSSDPPSTPSKTLAAPRRARAPRLRRRAAPSAWTWLITQRPRQDGPGPGLSVPPPALGALRHPRGGLAHLHRGSGLREISRCDGGGSGVLPAYLLPEALPVTSTGPESPATATPATPAQPQGPQAAWDRESTVPLLCSMLEGPWQGRGHDAVGGDLTCRPPRGPLPLGAQSKARSPGPPMVGAQRAAPLGLEASGL